MVIVDLIKLKKEKKRVTLGIHQYNPLSRCRTNFVQKNQRYIVQILYSYKNTPGGKYFSLCFRLAY